MSLHAARTSPEPERARTRWPGATAWSVTVLGVVVVAWFGFDLLRQCSPVTVAERVGGAAQSVAHSLADVLRPTVVSNPLVVLRGEDDSPKLVVYTHTADVIEELTDERWFGDSVSRITARNCRVQFMVPLGEMEQSDIVFERGTEGSPARIVVTAPRPKLDTGMLVIAPEEIEFTEARTGFRTVTSWLETDHRDELVRRLRPRLLQAMSTPEVRARAQEAGRAFFEKRFEQSLLPGMKLGRDVQVEVRWK